MRMKWNDLLVQIAVYAVFALPVLFILRSWRDAFIAPRMPRLHVASLIAATLSQAFLLASLIEPRILGPGLGSQPSALITVNVVVMLVAAIVAAVTWSAKRRRLVMTCIWQVCLWMIMWTVGTAD